MRNFSKLCRKSALADPEWSVRCLALEYLAKQEQGMPLVVTALTDEQPQVRKTVATILQQTGGKAIPYLQQALADKKFAAVHSLIRKMIAEIKQAEAKQAATPQPDHK